MFFLHGRKNQRGCLLPFPHNVVAPRDCLPSSPHKVVAPRDCLSSSPHEVVTQRDCLSPSPHEVVTQRDCEKEIFFRKAFAVLFSKSDRTTLMRFSDYLSKRAYSVLFHYAGKVFYDVLTSVRLNKVCCTYLNCGSSGVHKFKYILSR